MTLVPTFVRPRHESCMWVNVSSLNLASAKSFTTKHVRFLKRLTSLIGANPVKPVQVIPS